MNPNKVSSSKIGSGQTPAGRLLTPAALMIIICSSVSVPAQTRIGSVAFHRSATAAAASSAPILSADGRTVAFLSAANNLVTNDDLGTSVDVFVRDLPSGRTTLASVNLTGVGGGNDYSGVPGLSADGRLIVFESTASNLVADDTNGVADVFVRDLATGQTRLVSVPASGQGSANGPSTAPLISADGRWVFFESAASDLVTTITEPAPQLYARDLVAGVTVLISADTTAAGPAPGPAVWAAITPDGRFAAFTKRATQTVQGVRSDGEVYVRDRVTGVTTWVSAKASRFDLPSYLFVNAALSADGRYVIFRATTQGQGPGLLFWHDRQQDVTAFVDLSEFVQDWPSLSADGRFVAYATTNGVFWWDSQNPGTHLICENLASPSCTCTLPVLSADASRLAYVWTSNNAPTVVVQDRMGGARRVASLTTNGLPAVASDTLPVLSPDGGKVLFEAIDSRLVVDDWNRATDVFLHDLSTRETQLVSRRHADRPALTAAASMRAFPGFLNAAGTHAAYPIYDDDSPTPSTNQSGFVRVHDLATGQLTQLGVSDRRLYDPMLSADGRYVGYSASVRRLMEPSRDGQAYWQDLLTGSNILIAAGIFAPFVAISSTDRTLALSGDGQKLAFQSVLAASNFVPGRIENGSDGPDIFVRDMRTGSNQLVSIRRDGTALGYSTSPVFSPDGRWVVFQNTPGGMTPALYARDLVEQKTVLLAGGRNPDPVRPTGRVSMASFSADSRFVSYSIGYWRSELFDLYASTNALVCTNCDSLSLSGDGRWVAFRWLSPGPGRLDEIYVRDMHSDALEWISVSPTGGTNIAKYPSKNNPRISYDGRYVVFASTANDLVPNDTNAASDIFVRDRFRGLTFLASLNSHGTQSANGASFNPVLAADGRTILFTSEASDLVEGDYNEASDVFVLRLGGPDTDQDGLDDDWELAYFNTLNRDGSGDFDGDGQNDKAEFAAGTDPTNSGSIFRVRTITPLAGLGTKVEWEAVPGRAYRVQWKESVDDPGWAEAGEVLVASGTTAAWTDPQVDSPQRFYRAILVR